MATPNCRMLQWVCLLLILFMYTVVEGNAPEEDPNMVSFCCEINQVFDMKSGWCIPQSEKHLKEVMVRYPNGSIHNIPISTKVSAGFPNCSRGMFQLNPHERKETDKFSVMHTGHLQFGNSWITPNEYCLLHSVDSLGNTSNKLTAIVCFPENSGLLPTPIKFIIMPIFLSIAALFLFLTFIVYCLLPEIRDLLGKCIMSMSFSLGLSYVLLVIMQIESATINYNGCVTLSFLLHFWFLAAFFWLNLISFNTWLDIVWQDVMVALKRKNGYLLLSLYGWGGPLFLLILVMILDLAPGIPDSVIKPGFGELTCWFKDDRAILAYFYGPIALLLTLNLIFFIWVCVVICRKKALHASGSHSNITFKQFLKLLIVMGLTWIFDILSWAIDSEHPFWYVTDILNILQGVFIFIIFVCRKDVLRSLKKVCCGTIYTQRLCLNCLDQKDDEVELDGKKIIGNQIV